MPPEIRVLFITTEPEDQPRPPYTRELEAILQEMKNGGASFRAEHAFHATRRRVMEALESSQPDVVHFLCHGNPEGLMIEDDYRASTLVSEGWLTDVFAACPTVRLVVLNACKSAGLAQALATHARTAILGAFGWPDLVTADDARNFVAPFYNRLALNDSTQNAFGFARRTMDERDAAPAELQLREGEDFRLRGGEPEPGPNKEVLDEREETLRQRDALLEREEALRKREEALRKREEDLDRWYHEQSIWFAEPPKAHSLKPETSKPETSKPETSKPEAREPETPEPASLNSLPFIPSNINLDGIDLATLGDMEVDDLGGHAHTNTESMSGRMKNGKQGFKIIDQPDGTRIAVYVFKNVRIGRNASLKFSGTNAGALVALETMTIYGGITATSGGFKTDGSLNPLGGGPGGGGPARNTNAGGGGSYGGRGGQGAAASAGEPGAPGAIYGTPELRPLLGGSSGGATGGGHGGGAIQLVAGKRLFIGEYGHVSCGGGGGGWGGMAGWQHGHGGGSGGAILLEAPIVEVAGVLAVNGGGGGASKTYGAGGDGLSSELRAAGGYHPKNDTPGGAGSGDTEINGEDGKCSTDDKGSGAGGGAGRIRINTTTGEATITGKVSPALSTDCATQGKLLMHSSPSDAPAEIQ